MLLTRRLKLPEVQLRLHVRKNNTYVLIILFPEICDEYIHLFVTANKMLTKNASVNRMKSFLNVSQRNLTKPR